MNDRKDGGPAFPVTYMHSASPKDLQEMKAMARGISLRDYFAAKAMQALFGAEFRQEFTIEEDASCAYRMADAMLKAREQ